MRFKYYLRGLGLGIIFAVIIIRVSSHDDKPEEINDTEISSVQEHNNSEQNLVNEMIDSENESETEEENFETVQNNSESGEASSDQQDNQPEQNQQNDNLIQQNQQVQQNPVEQQTTPEPIDYNTAQTTQTGTVIITVSDGEVCRGVAEELQARGLISDAEDFRKFMGAKGYASFIHNGQFVIPVGSSYEQIAAILLGR